ncbi:MAG: DNA repair protein RecN [Pyrinomonadaceae bacterium]
MLSLLKIENIALIDELAIEFGEGLNLLTGETGSGKSIIIDSLGALTGSRVTTDLIKDGQEKALIEGLFEVSQVPEFGAILVAAGIESIGEDGELIVRRELSTSGKNRVFINNNLVTQALLRELGPYLADIHGQGEQASLFDPARHLELLDLFCEEKELSERVSKDFSRLAEIRRNLRELVEDDASKLQLIDVLRFQIDEITRVAPQTEEDEQLEDEKKKLANIEKLSGLSKDIYGTLYENDDAVISSIDRVSRLLSELADFDPGFGAHVEGMETARAFIEDLAIASRDYLGSIDFSPGRLEEIETRLAELAGLKRKYGGSIEAVARHLEECVSRLERIETAGKARADLESELETARAVFLESAKKLSARRLKHSKKFSKIVEEHLASVALEKAKFEVRFALREDSAWQENGIDDIEFFFSANPGEPPKPLARVASGGEASRLMLILKTAAGLVSDKKAVVFDEVDAGIGGRVAEAVGLKLKTLSETQQILCVTHQPQVASLADKHFLIEKTDDGKKTKVSARELTEEERLEEIARMLAGEVITQAARENAREMMGLRAEFQVRSEEFQVPSSRSSK